MSFIEGRCNRNRRKFLATFFLNKKVFLFGNFFNFLNREIEINFSWLGWKKSEWDKTGKKCRGTLKRSFYFSFCPPFALPPFRPTLKIFPDFAPPSDVRPGAITVGSILYSGANHYNYWLHCIGPRSDVGQGQCQEKLFMVGRSVGRRGEGRRRALSDGWLTEYFTSL